MAQPMMLEGVQLVHAMPGRVRLRVNKVRGNPAFAQEAQDRLAQVPGVRKVEVKPSTGSVLILFDAAALLAEGTLAALTDGFTVLFPELGADAVNLGIHSLVGALASGEKGASAGNLAASLGKINDRIAGVTGGYDLKLLIPMSLIFLAVRSLWTSKKVAIPVWYDYLWFAFASFGMLNQWSETQAMEADLEKRGKGEKVSGKK